MAVFKILKGPYLFLFVIAVILHLLLAYYAPNPNGYVYDFYSKAIILFYENGQLPSPDACFVCYHPPLLTILGGGIFHVVDWFGGGRHVQLFSVAFILNSLSLIFAIYSFAIYQHYRKNEALDLVLWGLLLFLPVAFISAFSIESDMLGATFIVISTYYFIRFLSEEKYTDLIIAGLLIALSAMTKYTGAIVAVYFGGVLLARYLQHFNFSHFKHGMTYAVVVFLVGSYPYLNNISKTGSPIIGNEAWDSSTSYPDLYDFTSFNIKDVIKVFEDPRKLELNSFKAFNSEVLTSHYGQLWTDFSVYSRANRHGQWFQASFYTGKYIPSWILWGLLVAGLIPVIAGFGGFLALVISREATLLLGMFVLCIAIYINWFLGHYEWMLKTKYHLYLLPIWLIAINKAASYIPTNVARALLIPSVIFSAIYCFFFAVY